MKDHEYLRRILLARKNGVLSGGLFNAATEHDNWCPFLKGGTCRCDPTITVTVYEKNEVFQIDKNGQKIKARKIH